jgi:hypothetical protein
MNDLNKTCVSNGYTGWDQLELWLDSVNYWTNRLNQVDGKFRDSYQHSIDQAWRMVDIYLLPQG